MAQPDTIESIAAAQIDMLLSSTHSFQLTQRETVQVGAPVFLENAYSFQLTQRETVQISGASVFLRNSYSFQLTREPGVETSFLSDEGNITTSASQGGDQELVDINDRGRRTFLKVASIAGASVIASQLAPKKAQALIMGSSPTTGVVGVKDSSNVRINPATEETAATLLKTSDLTFDAGALEVKVTSVAGEGSSSFSDSGNIARSALVDAARHVQVDVLSSALPSSASTETTLQTISFGGFKFALRLDTVGDIDYVGEAAIGTATSAASWRIKKIDSASGLVLQWAGTGVFDQVWDNRVSLSYS